MPSRRHILLRRARRRRARGRTAARQGAGDAGAGGHAGAVRDGEAVAAGASGVRLRRGVRGSRDHRRAGRLVRRGGAVSQAVGIADPAYRDHPEQSASHRRQARRIHRGAFSRSRAGRCQTAPDRFRLLHRRLAARPQAQHRSGPLRAAAVARGGVGDRNVGPDDLHHPPDHHPVAVDRSRAARRRHAARLRGGGPASGPARRHPARGASIADPAGNHGDDPREDPRRIADAAQALSHRQIPGEQDRRLRDRILRRGAQRSQASVPRRVRSHGAVVRRPARQRPQPMPTASTD